MGASLLRAWAITVIYNWFLPTTFNLPIINLAEAYGISLLIYLSTVKITDEDMADDKDMGIKKVIYGAAFSLVSVAFAWIAKQFI